MTRTISLLSAAVVSIVVSSCTYNNGAPNKTGTGAVIGGLTGAALGGAIGNTPKSTIIGGAIGAAVGGAIGQQMANQERDLRQSLAGTGADVTYTGDQLRVILPEAITFQTASAVVNAGFLPALADIAASIRRYPNSIVRVVGHTDNVGGAAYNDELSAQRALAVAQILIRNGADASRITYSGRGYREPVASNLTAAGRAQNRRVEIVITPTG